MWTRSAQMLPLKRGIAECSGLHRATVSAKSDPQLPLRSALYVLRGRGGWNWHWRDDCHRAAPHAWLVYRRGALAAWRLQIQSKKALGAEPYSIGVITALQLHPQLSQHALRQHYTCPQMIDHNLPVHGVRLQQGIASSAGKEALHISGFQGPGLCLAAGSSGAQAALCP